MRWYHYWKIYVGHPYCGFPVTVEEHDSYLRRQNTRKAEEYAAKHYHEEEASRD